MISVKSVIILLISALSTTYGSRDGLFDDDLYKNVLDPELCREQLASMRPFEFYDASFRIPQGIIKGGLSSLGNYHQCLNINQETEAGSVEGKYCLMQISLATDTVNIPVLSGNSYPEATWNTLNVSEYASVMKKYEGVTSKLVEIARSQNVMLHSDNSDGMLGNLALSLALCIPKACSVADVMSSLASVSPVPFSYTEQYCRLPDDKPFSAADYVAVILFSIIGVLTVLSTGYDLNHIFVLKKDPKTANELYRCCSVYTNMNRLTTISKTPGSLDCLDGMRSLSILWIIIGHVYGCYLTMYASNLVEFLEFFSKKRAIWFRSASVSVDTFFVMSGLLLVYTSANKMNQMKLIKNLHWFYLNRLLRLFPLLAVSVLLQASVFFRVTDGPNWWYLGNQVQNCREYWWSTLLHIQNFVNPFEQCVPQTWYLSVDIQLHIASPLLLFWLLGSRRSAFRALIIGLVAIATANIVFVFLTDLSDPGFNLQYYYQNPLIRAVPFATGMLFGYFLHLLRGKTFHMPKALIALGYLLALMSSSYAMYQAYPDWDSEFIVDLNFFLSKLLWALPVCWLIFACVCGYGGPINWFLSLSMWKFTARISYAMFLFHFTIMFMDAGSLTQPFYYSNENIFLTFAGVTAYTVIASIAACVLFDAPCSTLQKMMMTALTPSAKPTPSLNSIATTTPENKTNINIHPS